MYPFSIGVILDSFRTDLTTALDKAVAVGASGLQVYATSGAFSPESLSPQKRLCQPGEESRTHRAIQAHSGFGQGFGD